MTELPHGLRDLTDLDLLLRDAALNAILAAPDRTRRRNATEPLAVLCPALSALFSRHAGPGQRDGHPGRRCAHRATLTLMDSIFTRVLAPDA